MSRQILSAKPHSGPVQAPVYLLHPTDRAGLEICRQQTPDLHFRPIIDVADIKVHAHAGTAYIDCHPFEIPANVGHADLSYSFEIRTPLFSSSFFRMKPHDYPP
jgi:hypothetical protein